MPRKGRTGTFPLAKRNTVKHDLTMPLTDPTHDLDLLRKIRAGDSLAFNEIYRRHQGPLYRFAILRCGSADTAADIVQEIFMGLLTETLKFDPARGALQSFLFGVARNFALKRDERDHRHVSLSRDDDGEDDVLIADTAPDTAEKLIRNEQAETVRRALRQIAPHYRDVLILYEMHDLSYVDIAQICQIDLGTVRSRLSRARSRLAALLKDLDPNHSQDRCEASS
jgi:RNA polymerase sigma-70 factor (ECF subfamily)